MRNGSSSLLTILSVLLVSAAAVATTSATATAEDEDAKKWKADPARGGRLSETLCSSCHVVSSDQNNTAIAGIPTFQAIANMPGRTAEFIRNTLIRPHAPMPDVQLSQHEIGDIIAYIDQFRAPTSNGPTDAEGGHGKSKPVYPSPS